MWHHSLIRNHLARRLWHDFPDKRKNACKFFLRYCGGGSVFTEHYIEKFSVEIRANLKSSEIEELFMEQLARYIRRGRFGGEPLFRMLGICRHLALDKVVLDEAIQVCLASPRLQPEWAYNSAKKLAEYRNDNGTGKLTATEIQGIIERIQREYLTTGGALLLRKLRRSIDPAKVARAA